MNVFQNCSDSSDATPLSSSQQLYLKPVARLNISVQLPSLKTPGKSISNWEVMDKLRHFAVPEEFINLKVAKSTLEVVRFEGEIESRSKLPAVMARLDGRSLKLSGFHESLKVRAAEAKPDFPNRHSWDSYFRDAKNMNEMKPGERPDTIYITNLPCKWFAAKSDASKPSEYILRKVFEVFGEIRCVDIPMLDPFRSQMKSHISGIKMFSNNQNMIFEAYVQFKEYICFVKAMDALRGMKLMHKDENGKAFTASVKVDFDKTKHLSDSSIRRRRVERERLMAKEREREDEERRKREEEERKLVADRKRLEEEKAAKLERQRQREERRKAKMLEKLKHREADEMNKKIATEERLLLIAQRRLESFRLLGELFNRLRIAKESDQEKKREKSRNKVGQRKHLLEKSSDDLQEKEKELRDKLVNKFKHNTKIDKANSRNEDCGMDTDPGIDDEPDAFNDLHMDNEEQNQGFQRGRNRGGRFRGRWRSNNMHYRGHQYPQPPAMPFPGRGGFLPRGFPRWPRFPRRRGGGDTGFFPPPFMDPYYLANDPYYKYFQKIAFGDRNSRSRSRSRSSSRSYSRSYSRSKSRSRSRSLSRYRHSRSRSKRTRSRSRSRSRGHRSRSRRSRSRHKSQSSRHSHKSEKREKDTDAKSGDTLSKVKEGSIEKVPSVHTWSRSPSRSRSLSWEKRKDEPSSSTGHKQKKDKKKKKKKKKKDDK